MKFKFEPNRAIVQNLKNKMTGKVTKFLVCTFDENGEFETNDQRIINVLKTKLLGVTWEEEIPVEGSDEVVQIIEKESNPNELDHLTDDDIREMAKNNGIKSWHVKSIKRLKKELGV